MKVLVATALTQGARANDYHWAIEGELVRLCEVCPQDRKDPDGECGCGRGFTGLGSHGTTTTARVAELDATRTEYLDAVRGALYAQGWSPCQDCSADIADDLAAHAADLPVGAVLERRLDQLQVRAFPHELAGDAA